MMNSSKKKSLAYSPIGGAWLIAIGLGIIAFRFIMRHLDPKKWTGPNIGSGLLLVTAYVIIVCGLLWWLVNYLDRRSRSKEL